MEDKRQMKRFLTTIMMMFFLTQATAWAELNMKPEDVSGRNGDTLTISLYVSNDGEAKSINAFQLFLAFDKLSLTFERVDTSNTLSENMYDVAGTLDPENAGRIKLSGIEFSHPPVIEANSQDNIFLNLIFSVNPDATTDSVLQLTDLKDDFQTATVSTGLFTYIPPPRPVYVLNAIPDVFVDEDAPPIDKWHWDFGDGFGGLSLTDENGYYEVVDLLEHANDYIISILHDDYAPAFFNAETTTCAIHSAEKVSPSYETRDIVLEKGVDLAGKVTFNDISVENILISVQSETTGMVKSKFSTSDNTGNNFIIKGVPANDAYVIRVSSDDYLENSIKLSVESSSIDDIYFSLEKKEGTRIIHGTIAGLEPGKEVRIYASSSLLKFEKSYILTGSDLEIEAYTITDLKPSSDYTVRMISTDYPDLFYDNAWQQQNAHELDLTTNNVFNANFTIPQNRSTISGTIFFPENATKGEQICVNAVSESLGTNGSSYIIYNGKADVPYTIKSLIIANDYKVSIQSDKYRNMFYDQIFIKEEAIPVSIENGEAVDINFNLTRGTSISGKIYDDYNNPLSTIDVSAFSEKTGSFGKTKSLSDGSYIIEGLDFSDDFVLTAKKNNQSIYYYSSQSQCVTNSDSKSFVSTHDGVMTDINIVMCSGEQICGTVWNENGEFLENIRINIWSERKKSGGLGYTEKDGHYCIDGLPHANDYQVSAIPDPTTAYVFIQKNGISSNSNEINFYLSTGYRLDGIVYDNENNPIPDVIIEIRSLLKQIELTSKTDSSGRFILNGLTEADDYIIEADPAENIQLSPFIINNVVIQNNCSKTIILQPGFEFSGHIYDSNQNPVSQASIIVFSNQNNFQKTTTSTINGEYRISNVPDANDYLIRIYQDGYERQEIRNQHPSENTDYYLSHSGIIQGTITYANGLPVPNAFVMVYCEA
ncbi:MAG: hypothetical protein OMM_08854, partial [Candidatus Magnetoglobus multicellularis str. Araruama]